jgi:hypothetical protein
MSGYRILFCDWNSNSFWQMSKTDWKPFLKLGGITDPERIKAGEEILNRMMNQFIAEAKSEQKAEDYRRVRWELKEIGRLANGNFPVGFWDDVWNLLNRLNKEIGK